jgi:hypothetical protein
MYHSARSGPALDDNRDEYCIIKYVKNLEKNIKEKNEEGVNVRYNLVTEECEKLGENLANKEQEELELESSQ